MSHTGLIEARVAAAVGGRGDLGCIVSFPMADLTSQQAFRAGDMLGIAARQGLTMPATFDRVVENLGRSSTQMAEVLLALGQRIQELPTASQYNCLLGAATLGSALYESGPVRTEAPNLSLLENPDTLRNLMLTLRLERQHGIRGALQTMPNYLALLDRHLARHPARRGGRIQALDTAAFALRLAGIQPLERSKN
jgi:hypothetical protein